MTSIPGQSGPSAATPADRTAPRQRVSVRRILFQVHLWVGLILCVPLVLLGLTGTLLVFQHDLEEAGPRATAAGEARPVSETIAAASAAAPAGLRLAAYSAPAEAGEPAVVRFSAARGGPGAPAGPGGNVQVLVDPVSLEILGTRGANTGWLRQMFVFHANFFAGRDGRDVVGWFGVVMLVLGTSGLVLWWPRRGRWGEAFGVARGARGYRLHRELHGAVGFWGLVVFMVVSFSGVYLAFPQTTGEVVRAVFPGRDLRGSLQALRVEPVRGAEAMAVDDVVALVRGHVGPELQLRGVAFAARPEQPVRVTLVGPGHAHGAPAVTAFVDPWTRQVIELRDPRHYTTGETIMAWQHALHGGEGLGWVWKILVALSGLLPLLFAITGTTMWLMKRRAKRSRG